jgi:hypothetical protein
MFEDSSEAADDNQTFTGATGIRETPLALLIKFSSGKERWIPKRFISDDSELYNATDSATGKLIVAGWWCEENL